jgi:type IV secretory pathway VirD2 relaxase
MREDEFHLRLGRIRSRGVGGPRTFVGEALAAAQRAGGVLRPRPSSTSRFGRGRAASLRAQQGLGQHTRGAVIKARVVRQGGARGRLGLHLDYLQREGVTQDGERGRLFDAASEAADGKAFTERCADDRHHFRFIVSPDDADQLSDLKAYTRDLMRQAEADLGTGLDWVAVDHWNTGHPHIHVLVRGRDDRGADLVISRDYIREGLRARAGRLVTLELGPRTDADLRRTWSQQVVAERWTALDRGLAASVSEIDGLIDLRPPGLGRPAELLTAKVARARHLEALGLAQEVRPGRWRLAPDAEPTLRAIGQRGDVIARIHRALGDEALARDPARFVVDAAPAERLVGRLAGRGLHDELTGAGYAVVEGVDGRVHHVRLRDLDDAADARLGAIVEVSRSEWQGRPGAMRISVRSDLTLSEQVCADGATWLDRQLVGTRSVALGEGGFADEVRQALSARVDHLAANGLARRAGTRPTFARDLLETLRQRDLESAVRRLEQSTGLTHRPAPDEGAVAGVYRQRLNLASGRFAMIDTGLGFTLVPWRPEMEHHLGRELSGLRQAGGGIAWTFGPRRGPSR